MRKAIRESLTARYLFGAAFMVLGLYGMFHVDPSSYSIINTILIPIVLTMAFGGIFLMASAVYISGKDMDEKDTDDDDSDE